MSDQIDENNEIEEVDDIDDIDDIDEETKQKRLKYREIQKKYLERNSDSVVCQGCFKTVKKYYFFKHLKGRYHKFHTEKNTLNNIVIEIDNLKDEINELKKRINKVII